MNQDGNCLLAAATISSLMLLEAPVTGDWAFSRKYFASLL